MLVSTLATRETILSAYQQAVEERYRFFSFGDAMFIRPKIIGIKSEYCFTSDKRGLFIL